jgi:hypothetical protein
MMYAKYSFIAALVAAATNVNGQAVDNMQGGSCDSSFSSCGAHSSSCRSFGVPSCGMPSCDSSCVSDKKEFEKSFPTANLVPFYIGEGMTIDGEDYTADKMDKIPPKEEGGEPTDFKFASGTGAFKVSKKTDSGPMPEGADDGAGVPLTEGDIVVGWKGASGSYLLNAPAGATDLVTVFGTKTADVKGFYVIGSNVGSGRSYAEAATDEKPADAGAADAGAADGTTDPATGTEDPDAGKKEEGGMSGMKIAMIAVAIVVVLAVIGVVVYFVMAGGDDAEEDEETEEEEEAAEEA